MALPLTLIAYIVIDTDSLLVIVLIPRQSGSWLITTITSDEVPP
jgi:hypothetical protein